MISISTAEHKAAHAPWTFILAYHFPIWNQLQIFAGADTSELQAIWK